MFHTLRYKIKENLLQLPCIDRPPVRRKSDLHAQHDVSGPRIYVAGRALQHLLSTAAHRDQAALARAFCLKRELIRPPSELSRQLVLQRNSLIVFPIQFLWEARCASGSTDAHL